jgi:hypothetical protein
VAVGAGSIASSRLTATDSSQSFIIQTIAGFDQRRIAAEADLSTHSVAHPLPQRADWQRANAALETVLFIALTPNGDPVAAASASIGLSRALPGHRVYRVERLGGSASREADEAVLGAVASAAQRDHRCLRLVVEIFERDRAIRVRLGDALIKLGFLRAQHTRMYRRTLGIDLGRRSRELFASVHKTARRAIRGAAKRGLEVRPITEASLAPRLVELTHRSGRIDGPRPWAQIVRLSASSPEHSRIVGLFDTHRAQHDALLAFAWGCLHGSYVSYEDGASVRSSEPGDSLLGCAPLWDLIVWANEQTDAAWFDLGGIATDADGAVVGSELKRYFSRAVIDVGEDWSLEPSKVRAAIARGVSDVAHWIDDIWRSNTGQLNRSIARWADAETAASSRSAWSIYRVNGHTLLLPTESPRNQSADRER